MAVITRKSIRQALKGGITASQIVRFLKMHAHPKQLKTGGKDVIPPTIIDQIYLWQKERDRWFKYVYFFIHKAKLHAAGSNLYIYTWCPSVRPSQVSKLGETKQIFTADRVYRVWVGLGDSVL